MKAISRNDAEELVKNGTFASILSAYTNTGTFYRYRNAIADQVSAKRGNISLGSRSYSISQMVKGNPTLFKDPKFVRSLKSGFATIEKNYEHNRESDICLVFEIVRNL